MTVLLDFVWDLALSWLFFWTLSKIWHCYGCSVGLGLRSGKILAVVLDCLRSDITKIWVLAHVLCVQLKYFIQHLVLFLWMLKSIIRLLYLLHTLCMKATICLRRWLRSRHKLPVVEFTNHHFTEQMLYFYSIPQL